MDIQNQHQAANEKDVLRLVFNNWGAYCSSCGAKKDESDLKIMKRGGPILQIMSECKSCGLKTVISTINTQFGLGMQISQHRNDTSTAELSKFKTQLTKEDLLFFYNELNKINKTNDLLKLFDK